MTATSLASAIADRVIDEDEAIEAAESAPPALTEYLLGRLDAAAADDGIDDAEALAFAQDATEAAIRWWLGSRSGRLALRAAVAAAERTRKAMGGRGISARTVPTLERVTRAAVAKRLADRGSPRAESVHPGPSGTTGTDAGKAGGGA